MPRYTRRGRPRGRKRTRKTRPQGVRNKRARSARYIAPPTRRTFAKRQDVASFVHDSTWVWTPKPGIALCQDTNKTSWISINTTNPFNVFAKSGEEGAYGGTGTLRRDDVSNGAISIDLDGLQNQFTGPGSTNVNYPAGNTCAHLTDWIGEKPDKHRFRTLVVKGCKVTATIVPVRDIVFDPDGNHTTTSKAGQPITNFYMGKSLPDSSSTLTPMYFRTGQSNAELRALPFVKAGQSVLQTQSASKRCVQMSKGFSSAQMFGIKDPEDDIQLEITAQGGPDALPSGTNIDSIYPAPSKKGYIQLAWRPSIDTNQHMLGYQAPSTAPETHTCFPLQRFRLQLRVEYIVQMKEPLATSNIPRPRLIGTAPWNKRTGKYNPMSSYYQNWGFGGYANRRRITRNMVRYMGF